MSRLLVPVALDVLVVRDARGDGSGASGEPWAATAMRQPSAAAGGPSRQPLTPEPFAELPEGRPRGAYLHWAVPDALTRADPDSPDPVFPPLPDRWLVVRLSGRSTPGPRTVRTWLLPETSPRPDRPDLPGDIELPDLPDVQLGPTLTAVGYGDPGWAAAFDNVVGRFGLYDDLLDVKDSAVSYLVAGWYTRPTLDPLAGVTEATFWPLLERLGWSLDPDLPGADPVPQSCLFHGSAVAIGWPGARWPGGGDLGVEEEARPPADAVSVALGDTIAAAVATLGRPAAGSRDATDDRLGSRLRESALTGMSDSLDRPDWPARLDASLHRARFGSRPGRPVSEVVWQQLPPAPRTPVVGLPSGVPPPLLQGTLRRVTRPGPRAWLARDPAVVLHGAGRSFRHGGDGRFSRTGHLEVRTTDSTVTGVGIRFGSPGLGSEVLPADPLAGLALPTPECHDLLVELASTDPGSAADLDLRDGAPPSALALTRARLWLLRDPDDPAAALLEGVVVSGTMPSPLAISPPGRPWSPFRLDWSLGYLPSPGGVHDWALSDLDYEPRRPPPASAQRPVSVLTGSTVLTSHAAAMAEAGAPLDLLSGAFADLAARLRGDPLDPVVRPRGSPRATLPAEPVSRAVLALRAGWLQVRRLRLVDGFGRVIDLLPGPAEVVRSRGVDVPDRPDLLTYPPRFTAPGRVSLRLTQGSGGPLEAVDGISPVSGYLLASPLDGSIEFFDADGTGLGRLRPGAAAGTVWEAEPGAPATVGAAPSTAVDNDVLAALAEEVLAADRGLQAQPVHRRSLPALESLRRVLDVTRWTVDEVGAAGDEHLGLLLGHPVVVVRGRVDIEVEDPRHPPQLAATALPMRLGQLGHLQDGLLGYFVADDHGRLLVVDPAVADLAADGSTLPAYVGTNTAFTVQPGSALALTLLMVPGSQVHVTTGLLPRKAITLQRSWTAPAMPRISPTVRHGPVLRDPAATRLPVTRRVRGSWAWHRRPDPAGWVSDEVVPATDEALLPAGPLEASDGWLQLRRGPDPDYAGPALPVTCVRRQRTEAGVSVLAVGVDTPDGGSVLVPAAQAAALLEQRSLVLQTHLPGRAPVRLRAQRLPGGRRSLRAVVGVDDELLLLPECPPE